MPAWNESITYVTSPDPIIMWWLLIQTGCIFTKSISQCNSVPPVHLHSTSTLFCYVLCHKSTPSPSLSVQWRCCRHIVVSPYYHMYVPSTSSVIFCDIPGPLSSYQIRSCNNLFMAHHSSTWLHCPCATIHTHSQTWQSMELAPHGYFTSPYVCFILPCVFFYLIFILPCAHCHITNPYVSLLLI